jgi:hypothetical protein
MLGNLFGHADFTATMLGLTSMSDHPAYILSGEVLNGYRVRVDRIQHQEGGAETAHGVLVDESGKRPEIPFSIQAGASQYGDRSIVEDVLTGFGEAIDSGRQDLIDLFYS